MTTTEETAGIPEMVFILAPPPAGADEDVDVTPEQLDEMMEEVYRLAWRDNKFDALGERIFAAVWDESDGYGEPGYVPDQGYDWSGIRDSSDAAKVRMHAAMQAVIAAG